MRDADCLRRGLEYQHAIVALRIANLISPDNEKRNRSKFFFLSLGYDTMCDTLPGRPYEKLAAAVVAGRPARAIGHHGMLVLCHRFSQILLVLAALYATDCLTAHEN